MAIKVKKAVAGGLEMQFPRDPHVRFRRRKRKAKAIPNQIHRDVGRRVGFGGGGRIQLDRFPFRVVQRGILPVAQAADGVAGNQPVQRKGIGLFTRLEFGAFGEAAGRASRLHQYRDDIAPGAEE